jgi:hypothetical protein
MLDKNGVEFNVGDYVKEYHGGIWHLGIIHSVERASASMLRIHLMLDAFPGTLMPALMYGDTQINNDIEKV